MGVCSSKASVLPPPRKAGSRAAPDYDSAAVGVPVANPTGVAGHWAEMSPGKEPRRAAETPWQQPDTPGASADVSDGADTLCPPCESSAFDFNLTFPMMVMKMDTFMKMTVMESYEDMMAKGKVFEWKPDMGKIFFLSHQWTSFNHPDPASEQLTTAQKLLTTVRNGKLRDIFATEEEWQAYHQKESNRFMNFPPVTAEDMAQDVKDGYVWLDYSSVPQAKDAEEARLKAIDSIPYYVDHATVFIALVPRVEHKDLKGVFCDYKSWMSRGWCRLETQVHELRLHKQIDGEIMPGCPRLDIPFRPLIVHSHDYATTYDVFDNFYMLWQRKNSVFNGEFACCRLGHKVTCADGSVRELPCDKRRIRPLINGLWERKNAHLKTMHPVIRFFFQWRWASHQALMMAEETEDTGEADDPKMTCLDSYKDRYVLDDIFFDVFKNLTGMMEGMFASHPGLNDPSPDFEEFRKNWSEWLQKWRDCMQADEGKANFDRYMAISFACAEGNLPMVKKLHEEEGAPLDMGYMWGITLLDFAAGKGHMRIMKYLLEHDYSKTIINKPSFRERITATDRACKAGFVDALELLHSYGADIQYRRLNLQVPAHGAAIWGHTDVLRKLRELGADVLTLVDDAGKAPLDYAVYYCHKDAEEYLRSLGGEGYQTEYEKRAAASVMLQKHARRRSASEKRKRGGFLGLGGMMSPAQKDFDAVAP